MWNAFYDFERFWDRLRFFLRAWLAPWRIESLVIHNLPGMVPGALSRFRSLRHLRLVGSGVTELPELGALPALREVAIRLGTRLRELPEAISAAPLTELTCELESVPHALSRLTSLRVLSLTWHRGPLPDGLGALSELEELTLQCEQLERLPPSIGELRRLRKLWVWPGELRELPATLGSLESLEDLMILSNQLTALPDALGELAGLDSLTVSNNRLSALPDAIGNLPKLSRLDVSSNQLAALPETLGRCPLTHLNVEHNQLRTLPSTLNPASLKRLRIGRNPVAMDWLGLVKLAAPDLDVEYSSPEGGVKRLGMLVRPNSRRSELCMPYFTTEEARVLWVGAFFDHDDFVDPSMTWLPVAPLPVVPVPAYRTWPSAQAALAEVFAAHPLALQLPAVWRRTVDLSQLPSLDEAALELLPRLAVPAVCALLADAVESEAPTERVARLAAVTYGVAQATWLPVLHPEHGPRERDLLAGLAALPTYPAGKHDKHDGQHFEVAVREYDRVFAEYLRQVAAVAPALLARDTDSIRERVRERIKDPALARDDVVSRLRAASEEPGAALEALRALLR